MCACPASEKPGVTRANGSSAITTLSITTMTPYRRTGGKSSNERQPGPERASRTPKPAGAKLETARAWGKVSHR
jgi:hypothetical protein